ncbi:MAG: hypothetical protein QOH28_2724 [Actinomycetota bacterium]|nr:hypothetical protein [Actinomycetota bacterium]
MILEAFFQARSGPLALPMASGARLTLIMIDGLWERDSGHDVNESWGVVDLYWIPLGAGAHIVRVSGKVFEAVLAFVQRRGRCDLYHSALVVHVPEGRFVIEQTPVSDLHGERRGVVAEGSVGTSWAGRFRCFRYEIRRWRAGRIPDIDEAIASPVRLSDDLAMARRILALLPSVPTPVWGRDDLDVGEKWNSNSVISWVLVRSGADIAMVRPPSGGRAPGWDAGRAVAACALKRGAQSPGRSGSDNLDAIDRPVAGKPATDYSARSAGVAGDLFALESPKGIEEEDCRPYCRAFSATRLGAVSR